MKALKKAESPEVETPTIFTKIKEPDILEVFSPVDVF